MKKHIIIIVTLTILLAAVPLWAEEQLMTKLYFDNWLRTQTTPLEQQINSLQANLATLAETLRALKSQLTTEIKVTIGQKTALIDGSSMALDVAPQISGGRTLVPVRLIGEAFGAGFSWDAKAQKVTCRLEDTTIELYIGQKTARVNGKQVVLDTSPVIVEGRTMIPLRFVGQHMGATFEWDAQSQTATIFR